MVLQDLSVLEETTNQSTEKISKIRNYFDGSKVFLTGGTGTIGKLILEKLIRTCRVEKVYLLVREKKGIEPQQRLENTFSGPEFGPLRTQQPNFEDKISICLGDCLLPDLGLAQKDKEILKNEVNCVLHCAATVRFDASIREATHINVRALRDLIVIAKEMKRLTSFVYVSTAYSNCLRKRIEEVFYEPPIRSEDLINLTETQSDVLLDEITPILIKDWPNTYCFTKSVAESFVKMEGKHLPLTIIRPSIVIGTFKEPLPGFADNIFSVNGLFAAGGIGFNRVMHCIGNYILDVIPCDYVVNIILAAAWITQQRKVKQGEEIKCNDNDENDNNLVIYNCVSGCQNPITCDTINELLVHYGCKNPSLLTVWYYIGFNISNKYMYSLCLFLLHTVPGSIMDFLMRCLGKKPIFMKGYRKIAKLTAAVEYFGLHQWNFDNTNTQDLWNNLNAKDRELFEFDVGKINWKKYFEVYVLGLRTFLLKDPLDTIPQAKRRLRLLKIAHYSLLSLLCFLLYILLKSLYQILF